MTARLQTAMREGTKRQRPLIALLGNPNTGKSTIFNRLTGLRQRIANYHGITIEAHKGELRHGGKVYELLDLPGTYSLSATSPDERVAIDVLTGHGGREKPDAVVCILDATNLQRNLFLASQLAEFALPMVLVLNQWDVARKRGSILDVAAFEKELGVPVIPTVGTRGEGLDALREAIGKVLEKPHRMRRIEWNSVLAEVGRNLQEEATLAGDALDFFEAHRLPFDCNSSIKQRLSIPPNRLEALIQEGRERIRATGLNPGAAEAVLHYAHMDRILEKILPHGELRLTEGDHSIDALLGDHLGTALLSPQ